jgi:hypothetical protein
MTISLNENLKTRRKQLAILAAVIIGGAAAAGGVIWYGQYQQKQKQPAPVATPNLTGVVTARLTSRSTMPHWHSSRQRPLLLSKTLPRLPSSLRRTSSPPTKSWPKRTLKFSA